MDRGQQVVVLRKCPLFRDLPGEALLAVAEVAELREFSEGEVVYASGDMADGLYIVASGAINVVRRGQVLLARGVADAFGEVELLDGSSRIASAVGATDGTLLHLDQPSFESLSDDMPQVLRGLIERVVGYLEVNIAAEGEDPEQIYTALLSRSLVDRAAAAAPEPTGEAEAVPEPARAPGIEDPMSRTYMGELDLRTDDGRFQKVERGESVHIDAPSGGAVELRLARHTFTLLMTAPPRLVDSSGVETTLAPGAHVIGRDPGCDIVTPASIVDISRHHVRLDVDASGSVSLTGLSAFGTRVARDRIASATGPLNR